MNFCVKIPEDINVRYYIKKDYDLDAVNFLLKTHSSMVIDYLGCMKNENWGDKYKRNVYEVTLGRGNKFYTFKFWDSVNNTEKNERPTVYDILSCLTTYEVGCFEDFCDEFGYNTDSISAYKTYEAVREEYYNLVKMFTKSELEMLSEIQ